MSEGIALAKQEFFLIHLFRLKLKCKIKKNKKGFFFLFCCQKGSIFKLFPQQMLGDRKDFLEVDKLFKTPVQQLENELN